MSVMAALNKNDPIMIAWEAYKASPEYANTKHWAIDPKHVDGSLWSAWLQGRVTAHSVELDRLRARERELVEALTDCVSVMSGDCMTKSSLVAALERARSVLKGGE